jgi:hypothetical protein
MLRAADLRGELSLAHGRPDTVAKWPRRSIFNHKYLCNKALITEASLPRGSIERGKDAPEARKPYEMAFGFIGPSQNLGRFYAQLAILL